MIFRFSLIQCSLPLSKSLLLFCCNFFSSTYFFRIFPLSLGFFFLVLILVSLLSSLHFPLTRDELGLQIQYRENLILSVGDYIIAILRVCRPLSQDSSGGCCWWAENCEILKLHDQEILQVMISLVHKYLQRAFMRISRYKKNM